MSEKIGAESHAQRLLDQRTLKDSGAGRKDPAIGNAGEDIERSQPASGTTDNADPARPAPHLGIATQHLGRFVDVTIVLKHGAARQLDRPSSSMHGQEAHR
jgi:hypothetical protein